MTVWYADSQAVAAQALVEALRAARFGAETFTISPLGVEAVVESGLRVRGRAPGLEAALAQIPGLIRERTSER